MFSPVSIVWFVCQQEDTKTTEQTSMKLEWRMSQSTFGVDTQSLQTNILLHVIIQLVKSLRGGLRDTIVFSFANNICKHSCLVNMSICLHCFFPLKSLRVPVLWDGNMT